MAEHILKTPRGPLTLDLFPVNRKSTHRAWDAADNYLIEELSEHPDSGSGPVLLVNDSHGALHLSLEGRDCFHFNDSALSLAAISQNLKQNGQNPQVQTMGQGPYSLVLIKIPKTLSLLEYQLREIRKRVTPESRIIAGGMVRHIHRSTIELFEGYLGASPTSLARKKARLITSTFDPSLKIPPEEAEVSYSVEGIPEPLVNLPHLFSRDHLDRGTALLLQFLRLPPEGPCALADFGCGNGVIGIAAALKNPQATLLGVDESLLSVECSRINGERNGLGSRFRVKHSFRLEDGSFDYIFSNPPFHQGQKVDIGPALDFFKEAESHLNPGGRLMVVGNRHLGYHSHLQKIFGNCRTLAEREGYILLESEKVV